MDRHKERNFEIALRLILVLYRKGTFPKLFTTSNLYNVGAFNEVVRSQDMSEFLSWLRSEGWSKLVEAGKHELIVPPKQELSTDLQKYYDDPSGWQEALAKIAEHEPADRTFDADLFRSVLAELAGDMRPTTRQMDVMIRQYTDKKLIERAIGGAGFYQITAEARAQYVADVDEKGGNDNDPADTGCSHNKSGYPKPVVLSAKFNRTSYQLLNRFFERWVADCEEGGDWHQTNAKSWHGRCGYENESAYNQGLSQLEKHGIITRIAKGKFRWITVPPEWIAWLADKRAAHKATAPADASADEPDDNEQDHMPAPVASPEAEPADEPGKPDIEEPLAATVAAAGGEPAPTNHGSNGRANAMMLPSTTAIPRLGSRGASLDEFGSHEFVARGTFIRPPDFVPLEAEAPPPIVIEEAASVPPPLVTTHPEVVLAPPPALPEPAPEPVAAPAAAQPAPSLEARIASLEARLELHSDEERVALEAMAALVAAGCFKQYFEVLPKKARLALLDALWAMVDKS